MFKNLALKISSIGRNYKNLGTGKRITWIGVGVLILAVLIGFIYYRLAYLPARTASDQPQIQTAVIRQGDLSIYASGTGTLIAQSEASFGFDTSGQVTKVNVQVGDLVEAGQVLAELNSESATLAYQQTQRTMDQLTSPAAIATARQAIATAQDELVTTRAALQYLISPAVQKWQERLAEAQAALAQAQSRSCCKPIR